MGYYNIGEHNKKKSQPKPSFLSSIFSTRDLRCFTQLNKGGQFRFRFVFLFCWRKCRPNFPGNDRSRPPLQNKKKTTTSKLGSFGCTLRGPHTIFPTRNSQKVLGNNRGKNTAYPGSPLGRSSSYGYRVSVENSRASWIYFTSYTCFRANSSSMLFDLLWFSHKTFPNSVQKTRTPISRCRALASGAKRNCPALLPNVSQAKIGQRTREQKAQ